VPGSDWIRSTTNGFHEMAEILAKRHSVFVWHFDLFPKNKPFYEIKNVRIIRPSSIYSSDLSFYYGVNFIRHSLLFAKTVRELGIDVVIVQNVIPAIWAFAFTPSNVLKIFGFQDYYPESASVYYRNSSQVLRRLVESVSWLVTKRNIKSADICLCVCLSLNKMTLENGCAKSYFLPNGVDTNFYAPEKIDKDLKRKLGLSEHTIVFLGLIEPWLDFDTILQGIKLLKKDVTDAKLLIIGSTLTGYDKELRKKILEFGLEEDVLTTGYVPSESLPYYLNLGAMCVMPYTLDTYSGTIRLPLKFYIYSAMGKPILSVHLPEVKRLMPRHVLYYDSPESFAGHARVVFQDKKLQHDLSLTARNFSKSYDYSVLAGKVEEILEDNLKEQHFC